MFYALYPLHYHEMMNILPSFTFLNCMVLISFFVEPDETQVQKRFEGREEDSNTKTA